MYFRLKLFFIIILICIVLICGVRVEIVKNLWKVVKLMGNYRKSVYVELELLF